MSGPWIKFYPSDWRADPALRMCSIGARGLWIEMLCIMHEAGGYLLVNDRPLTPRQLAVLTGATADEVKAFMVELSDAGVFSRNADGTIYSRRMLKDIAKSEEDKANGRRGGNPKLKGVVNPPDNPGPKGGDKAQKPEARCSEANASGADAPLPDPSVEERAYFARGREILGSREGATINNLLKAKGGNVSLARAALEIASTKDNPREWVHGAIHSAGRDPPKAGRPSVQDVARALEDWTNSDDATNVYPLLPAARG